MKKLYQSGSLVLRQKAEERLKNNLSKPGTKLSNAETLRLIHELEVHQIELEMQNEELILAKEQAAIASDQYVELYDFAPSGYFTLTPKGEIIQLNFAGAALLGKDRSHLKNRLFHIFVSDNSKPLFLLFLEKVFDRHEKENCELMLSNGNMPKYIYLTGIVSENGGNCLITVLDITERKLLESSLVEKMILLNETEKAGKIGGWSFNVKTLIQNWTQETFNILEIDTTKGEPGVPEGIEFIDEPYRHKAELAINRAIEFGEPYDQKCRI